MSVCPYACIYVGVCLFACVRVHVYVCVLFFLRPPGHKYFTRTKQFISRTREQPPPVNSPLPPLTISLGLSHLPPTAPSGCLCSARWRSLDNEWTAVRAGHGLVANP